MITKLLIALLPILVSSCERNHSSGKNQLPDEIKQFQATRDLCDHFRGEEGYDAERRAFLLQQMKNYCVGTDEALRRLRLKYRDNRAVQESLMKYEDKVE